MQISPAVRHTLTVIASVVAALGALLASGQIGDVPEWIGVVIVVLSTVFASIGIVPGQIGGTQVGAIVAKKVEDMPPSDNIVSSDQSGFAQVAILLILMIVSALAMIAWATKFDPVVLVLAAVAVLMFIHHLRMTNTVHPSTSVDRISAGTITRNRITRGESQGLDPA